MACKSLVPPTLFSDGAAIVTSGDTVLTLSRLTFTRDDGENRRRLAACGIDIVDGSRVLVDGEVTGVPPGGPGPS